MRHLVRLLEYDKPDGPTDKRADTCRGGKSDQKHLFIILHARLASGRSSSRRDSLHLIALPPGSPHAPSTMGYHSNSCRQKAGDASQQPSRPGKAHRCTDLVTTYTVATPPAASGWSHVRPHLSTRMESALPRGRQRTRLAMWLLISSPDKEQSLSSGEPSPGTAAHPPGGDSCILPQRGALGKLGEAKPGEAWLGVRFGESPRAAARL